jgi:CDP-glycerol glycerophosphotransferase
MFSKLRFKIRACILAVLRFFPGLRRWARKLYWRFRERGYSRLSEGLLIEEKTVLFESYQGRSCSCSPKAIFLAMCADERFSDWQFIWSLREEQAVAAESLFTARASIVVRGSAEYFKACAQAKYWIVNNRMPEWVKPRPEQVFVQCWHGTPLKRLGYDVTIKTKAALNTADELSWRFSIDATKWSYLLSPSPFTSECLASAFGLQSLVHKPRIIEEGYPRNDSIVQALNSPERDELIEELKKRLGIPQGRKVLLCAPTWRDSVYRAGKGYGSGEMPDFKRMREALGDQWVVLIRTHYYVESRETLDMQEDFLIDATETSDINELYLAADVLLTDYSSVLFDYANTGRPVIYYWPDFEEYQKEVRGFYFDPTTLPGDKCVTTNELIGALLALDTWQERYGSDYQAFRKHFCPKDDGCATTRVLAEIFEK